MKQANGIHKKTTANWDPTSRDFKPWRDAPPLAKALPQLPPSMTNAPKPTWKPPKRTSAPLLPVSTPLPLALASAPSSSVATEAKKSAKGKMKKKKELAAAATAGQEQQQAAGARVRMPGVVYFKQLAFQRRGGNRVVAPDKPPVPTKAPSPPKKKEPEEQTLVHPLAVYDASWLAAPGYTVHVSLIARSNGGDASRFFLRVGSVFEHPNGMAEDLQVLAVLQNDVGRLLTPPLQYWIDLNVINVNEYYMGNFLQQSLRYIAERVRQPGSRAASAEQQMLLVEAVFESGDSASDDLLAAADEGSGSRRRRDGHKGNLIAVATEQRVRRDPRRSQPDLELDTTVAQRACRIPIGPVYDARWVMATVRLSLLYPDPEALLHDPLPTRYDDILKCVPVRQVVLHIFPTYGETKLGLRMVCFEPLALPVLIGPVDVDAVLKEGVQAAQSLLLRLCRLLNFREVRGRLRLGVTGAAILEDNGDEAREEEGEEGEEVEVGAEEGAGAGPEGEEGAAETPEQPWLANCIAEEARREQERKREQEREAHLDALVRRSSAAVCVQSIWRRALARARVALLRHQHSAAVPVQCFARRVIARHRARQRRQHLARERIEQGVLEEADGWAASLLVAETLCPAHRCVDCQCTSLQVCLGGTDVTLFAHFGLGGGGDGVIVHCLPAVGEGEDLCQVRGCSSVDVSEEDLEQMGASLYHLAASNEDEEDERGGGGQKRANDDDEEVPDRRACLSSLLRSPGGCGELLSLCAEGLSLSQHPRAVLSFSIDAVPLLVFHEDGDLGMGI